MIVITGGAGFIGSVLAWKFNQLGRRDLLLVDQLARHTPKWNNVAKLSFSAYAESDAFIEALERGDYDKSAIEAVFHMGACSDTTEMDVHYLARNNTEYSQRIAKWCLAHDVYLAYASSAAVYGDGSMGFADDDLRTPLLKPLNPYGQSKLNFDIWVLQNGYQRVFTGYRFFNVYGPNETHKGAMRSMIHKGFGQVCETGKMRLFKSHRPDYLNGGQKRDFVYVKDVVDAMIWFYQNTTHKGIFNLGCGHAQTWNDLAEALFIACQKQPCIEYYDMPENIRNQYQYFTEAQMGKYLRSGCPVKFCRLKEGVLDYVQPHLLTLNGLIA